ncbi:hypothetical protein [Streptomyces sp. RTd22]|uniref:hypothetical protein n=1 Tax=Streptomyces sp. RTd22 TaxID=1841249 RepID=UPI0007C5C947|nr:hypothetical protein [Streptomyces sp. RTd22]
MIATSAVGRWAWGQFGQAGNKVVACLRDLLNAYTVLAGHQLAVGTPHVSVSMHEAGEPRSQLFDSGLLLEAFSPPSEVAKQLADQLESARRPGTVGSVSAHIKGTGTLADGAAMVV